MASDADRAAWLPGWPFGAGSAGERASTLVMREALRRGVAALEGPRQEVAESRELIAPGQDGPLRARLYVPFGAGVGPGPGVVYFHGGGFAVGDLDSHDGLCRRLAGASRCRLLHVAYRLAPENKFPAAVEDALAAFDWAQGEGAGSLGFDPDFVAVGGDSAGGNLAATVALERDPAFQLLIYPLLQLVETNADRLRALEGHIVARAMLENARAAYLANRDDAKHPWASPLLRDDIAGAPPAYLVTAGLDPLHDEGRAYAERLAAAGVTVDHQHFNAAVHGFFQFTAASDGARDAVEAAGRALGEALGAPLGSG